MINRKKYWLIAEVVIATVVSALLAKHVYTEEERKKLYGNSLIFLALAVLFVGSIGSWVFRFVLPTPATYLPFITYQLNQWEKDMMYKIATQQITITSQGEVIK